MYEDINGLEDLFVDAAPGSLAQAGFLHPQFQALAQFFRERAASFIDPTLVQVASFKDYLAAQSSDYQQAEFMRYCLGLARKHGDVQSFNAALEEQGYARTPKIREFLVEINTVLKGDEQDLESWLQHQQKNIESFLALGRWQGQCQWASQHLGQQSAEVLSALESLPQRSQITPIRDSYRQYLTRERPVPLLIILAPPQLPPERFPNTQIQGDLTESLRQFLNQHYPLASSVRPTEFLGGNLGTQTTYGEATTKLLFWALRAVPTLVLESEINGDYFNLRVGYWALGQESYHYTSILSRLPYYRAILNEFARSRAQLWQLDREKYLELGKTPEQLRELGGDDDANLQILQEEIQGKRLKINRPRVYQLNADHLADFGQFLIACHQVLAAWFSDAFHLSQAQRTRPLLPELLTKVLNDLPLAIAQELTAALVDGYQQVYAQLCDESPSWAAEMDLDLAQSLLPFSTPAWIQSQIDRSLQTQLRIWAPYRRNEQEPLDVLENYLNDNDRGYLEQLERLLTHLGDTPRAAQAQRILNRVVKQQWQAEHRRQQDSTAFTLDLYRCSGPINNVIFSPDGQFLYSAEETTIKVWHLPSCEVVRVLEGHTDIVHGLVLYPGGQTLVSGSYDRTVRLWNLGSATTNNNSRVLTGHTGTVVAVAVSADGQLVASSGADRSIRLWDAKTGQFLRPLQAHAEAVNALAFSPNSQILASGGYDTTLRLWNLKTGQINLIRVGFSVYALAFSQDGQTIAVGSADNTITLWSMSTGRMIRAYVGHSGMVYALTLSADGQTLISGSADRTIRLWNLQNGEMLRTFEGHNAMVYTVALSPSGQTLASGSHDNTLGITQMERDYLEDIFALPISRTRSSQK